MGISGVDLLFALKMGAIDRHRHDLPLELFFFLSMLPTLNVTFVPVERVDVHSGFRIRYFLIFFLRIFFLRQK